MFRVTIEFSFIIIAILSVGAIPKPDDLKPFYHNSVKPDSTNINHFNDGHHNIQFDHESFLGEDEAKTFNQLPPEESKRRLGLIVDRINEDKDGFITPSELKKWIQYTQRRYIDEDVSRLWNQYHKENNSIKWDIYRRSVYGFIDEMDKNEIEKGVDDISYESMLKRDRRRWAIADQNLDDELTREEFTAFLHPEDHPTMREVVLTETIEDIDKNKDGKISVEEYIGDMYRSSEPTEEEPAWVLSERESFAKFRDLNGDGLLDRDEIRAWIVPKDFDHADSEAKHLIFEADEDGDEKLTKEEILSKYDVFVGSQATDFGEALARHDEF